MLSARKPHAAAELGIFSAYLSSRSALAGQSVQHCVPLVRQMGSLSKAEVGEKLAVLVGEDIMTKLRSANWKERLEAMGDLQQLVQDMKENTDVPLLFQVCTCDGCSPP